MSYLCASFWPRWYKIFWRDNTSLWFLKTKTLIKRFPTSAHASWGWSHRRGPHAAKAVQNAQYNKLLSPKSTAFIYAFLLFDVNNILNPSQTLWGALLPTAMSAPTWDYEAQSENLANPQLEELHWRNNKEIIKDHFNQSGTQVIKVELVHVCVWMDLFDNKVLSIEHKLWAVVGCAQYTFLFTS